MNQYYMDPIETSARKVSEKEKRQGNNCCNRRTRKRIQYYMMRILYTTRGIACDRLATIISLLFFLYFSSFQDLRQN